MDGANEYTCGITTNDAIYCWGWNGEGQLGIGSLESRTSPALVTGGLSWKDFGLGTNNHSCAVTTSGAGYCWGGNRGGQLGIGATGTHETPSLVVGGISWK